MTNEIIFPKVILCLFEVNNVMIVDVIDLFIEEILIHDKKFNLIIT